MYFLKIINQPDENNVISIQLGLLLLFLLIHINQ